MAAGLLVLRLVFGLLMAAHGAQKLFGVFGGYGLNGTAGFFESLGFRPGRLLAFTAGAAELVSGLLIAAGLFGPLGPALMVSVMIVAGSVHWNNGLFATNNGIEIVLLYAVAGATLALTGPGAWSIDGLLGFTWPAWLNLTALAIGVAGGVVNLLARRPAPATQQLKQAA